MIRKRRKKKKYNGPSFSLPNIEISDEVKKDVIGIFLFVVAFIITLSFINLSGGLGLKINAAVRILFGWGFILLPVVLVVWGWKVIKSENIIESSSVMAGIVIFTVSLLSFIHVLYNPSQMFEIAKEGNGGGFLGAIFAFIFVNLIGKWGAVIVFLASFVISLLLILNASFLELLGKIKFFKTEKGIIKKEESFEAGDSNDGEEEKEEEEKERSNINVYVAGQEDEKKGILSSLAEKISGSGKNPEFSVKSIEENENGDEDRAAEEGGFSRKELAGGEDDYDNSDMDMENKSAGKKAEEINWKMPFVNLLDGTDGEPTSGDIKANSNIIKRTLADFGIPVEMGEVNVGPTVTQYTLKPAVGIKLSRITSLQNDLALALAAKSLRIEAPIPGKSWAGIELPNQAAAMVRLRNILISNEFKNRKSNLSIILGRDVAGGPVLADLARMPHLMIAGSTGSGKTVCINTVITGLLFQNSPNYLKFIMIDPKRVELTSYNDIPHLLTPVITDPDKAINSLKWSISEMENRYDTLSHLGCRNIESYNAAVKSKYKQREVLPYIVIIIDELADLMATHGREMEAAVVRLAQMARAVGIHLILSTQRPSVEVITGLIKANITSRIAFQVASQIDSRTILDMAGAEKLLGSGDMLYLSGDSNKPKRIQGVFVSEEEVRSVAGFLKNQKKGKNEYDEEIIEDKKSSIDFSSDNDGQAEDSLYNEAVEVVGRAGKASASLLQRRLRVGYARAARLLDLMEEQGVIGPGSGAKPREVYIQNSNGGEEYEGESEEDESEE